MLGGLIGIYDWSLLMNSNVFINTEYVPFIFHSNLIPASWAITFITTHNKHDCTTLMFLHGMYVLLINYRPEMLHLKRRRHKSAISKHYGSTVSDRFWKDIRPFVGTTTQVEFKLTCWQGAMTINRISMARMTLMLSFYLNFNINVLHVANIW